MLGSPVAVLGPSSAPPNCVTLGALQSDTALGASWARLGLIWSRLEQLSGRLGAILGRPGCRARQGHCEAAQIQSRRDKGTAQATLYVSPAINAARVTLQLQSLKLQYIGKP